jgi:hypothetical protein
MRSDPHRPGTVYLLGQGVIACTNDNGSSWRYKSFSHYTNTLPYDLLIDVVDSNRWYIADGAAGFMLSTDAGQTWQYRNDGLFRKNWWYFEQVVQDRSRPNIMYLVSSERIYKSTDYGDTWFTTLAKFSATGGNDYVTALVINRKHPDSLYVFVENALVKRWISGDAGRTWVPDASTLGNLRKHVITEDGAILLGPYHSSDYGATWTSVKELALDRKKPSPFEISSSDVCVYDPSRDRYFLGCYEGLFSRERSDLLWRPTAHVRDSIGDQAWTGYLHYDPYYRSLWCWNSSRLYRSTGGGSIVEPTTTGPNLETTNYLVTSDYRGGIVMGTNSGTTDNGKTWHFGLMSSDYGSSFQCGAVSPMDSSFVVKGQSGFEYNIEGWVLPNRPDVWRTSKLVAGLATGHFHFNPHNPRELLGGINSGLYRVTDSLIQNAQDQVRLLPWILTPRDGNGNFEKGWGYLCMTFHPQKDGVYYLCSVEEEFFTGNPRSTLRRSTDYGITWIPLLDQLSTFYLDISVNPANPDIIVIASHHGILRSTDDGRSWSQNYNPPFQSALIKSVIIDPRYPNVYYCGAASVNGDWTHWTTGLRSGGMYVSYDYAETWEALPLDGMYNVSVRYIHYHENPRRLIVSTAAGIYEMLLQDYATNTAPLPLSAGLELRVYPNPANAGDMQTLRVYGAGGKHALVDLYSIQGRHVARVHEGTIEAGATLRQSTAGLPSGMYYYRVISGGEQRSVPVVIRK